VKIFRLLWLHRLHWPRWWLKVDIKSKRFLGLLGLGLLILCLSEGVLEHLSNRIERLRHVASFWELLGRVRLLHLVNWLSASLDSHCLLWLLFSLILGNAGIVISRRLALGSCVSLIALSLIYII